MNSKLFVSSQTDYHIDLIGPTRTDNHWQAKEGAGFAARDLVIDWEQKVATCPAGNTSLSLNLAIDRSQNQEIKIKFGRTDCQACALAVHCTRSTPPRRTISIRPQVQHEALLAGRRREQTQECAAEYARRAGVEGTISQGARSCDLRRSRYLGLVKTHLHHLVTAGAINVVRMLNWLAGEPKAKTRHSPFTRLFQPAPA